MSTKQTARSVAETRKAEALKLIDELRALVESQSIDTDNWGVAGSLGHTSEQVTNAVRFLRGY